MTKEKTIAVFDGNVEFDAIKRVFPNISSLYKDEFDGITSHICSRHGINEVIAFKYAERHKSHSAQILTKIYCQLFDEPLSTIKECVSTLQNWILEEEIKQKEAN